MLIPTDISKFTDIGDLDLLTAEERELSFRNIEASQRWLFVVEYGDSANGHHQLKILREISDKISWTMAHAFGDTKGERIAGVFRRYLEIMDNLREQIDRFER